MEKTIEEQALHFIRTFGDKALYVIEKTRNGILYHSSQEPLFEKVEKILKNEKIINNSNIELNNVDELFNQLKKSMEEYCKLSSDQYSSSTKLLIDEIKFQTDYYNRFSNRLKGVTCTRIY